MIEKREQTLYPGEAIADYVDFLAAGNRFSAPSGTTELPERWQHGDMVRFLLAHTSIRSLVAENIGQAEDVEDFSDELEFAKRDATIHVPGSDYIIPDWAAQFESVIRQVVEYEHAMNARAGEQVAQIRLRQYKGQPRNVHPHMDMVGSSVRNFHFYLVADQMPTTTFDGTFEYEPHPYEDVHANPLEFYRDLDRQFAAQLGDAGINRTSAEPFDIQALSALTVHEPPITMPVGRTLLAIQFYELTDTDTQLA